MSNHDRNLDTLFQAAAEFESAEERSEYLERACGNDIELRRQVEQLLQSDQEAGDFLENPPEALKMESLSSFSAPGVGC